MKRFLQLALVATIGSGTAAGGPLHEAAVKNNIVSMQSLIDQDPRSVNAINDEGETPLHTAALTGQNMAVQFLLANGAEVNFRNPVTGSTPLLAAAMMGHRITSEILLAAGAQINLASSQGTTPLHVAAYQGHRPMVEFLLERGANINAQDKTGLTPTQWALISGHREIAVVLLLADPELKSTMAQPPRAPPPPEEREVAHLREQILALTRALRDAEHKRREARQELEQAEILYRDQVQRLQKKLDQAQTSGDQAIADLQIRRQKAQERIRDLERQVSLLVEYKREGEAEDTASARELSRLKQQLADMAVAARDTEISQQQINEQTANLQELLNKVRQGLRQLQTLRAARAAEPDATP